MTFQTARIPLVMGMRATSPAGAKFAGVLLTAHRGSEVAVIACESDGSAKAAYQIVHSQATPQSFDRRRQNVLVTADDLTSKDRKQVLAALARLSN